MPLGSLVIRRRTREHDQPVARCQLAMAQASIRRKNPRPLLEPKRSHQPFQCCQAIFVRDHRDYGRVFRGHAGTSVNIGKSKRRPFGLRLFGIGVRGFEPPTSSSRTMRATRLRHTPSSLRPLDQRASGATRCYQTAVRSVEAKGSRSRRPGAPPSFPCSP